MKIVAAIFRALVLSLFCLTISSAAQTGAAKADAPQVTTGRTTTVPLFVMDGHGNPVSGVQQSQFVLLEDNVARPIVAIHTASEMPLKLGLLIDTSNSEHEDSYFSAEIDALGKLLGELLTGANDQVFIDPFDANSNASSLMNKEEFSRYHLTVRIGGGTALFDAIDRACDRLKTSAINPERRVLIVLSDGDDNHSRHTLNEAIAAAQEAGVVIFTINSEERLQRQRLLAGSWRLGQGITLEDLAQNTGGKAFGNAWFGSALTKLKAQIQNMYSLTYETAEHNNKAQLRSIKLKFTGDKKVSLRISKAFISPSVN